MSVSSRIFSSVVAMTAIFLLAACGDIDVQTMHSTTTTTTTVAATTTTTIDLEAARTWMLAVSANQRAEQARLANEANAARRRQQQTAPTNTNTGPGAGANTAGLVNDGGKLCYGPCVRTQRACAIPQYICNRESGGWANVKNPISSASGKYQFLDSTWSGFGGYTHAGQAPEAVQDQKAAQLWAGGRGCSHWSAC